MSKSKPGLKKYLTLLAAAVFITMAFANTPGHIFKELSLTQLEDKLYKIDTELQQLAHYSMRTGIGSIGYRSYSHDTAENPEWVQIDLAGETPIDQVILVPVIWRDTKRGFKADGFPEKFRILAGTDQTTNVIAEYSSADQILPRIAPLLIPCSVTASWIRLEATRLSPRAFDGAFDLELAEIMVFSGEENVALHQTVHTPHPDAEEGSARHKNYLVDGFVPYLMDAASGEQSIAMVSRTGIGDHPSLTFDLGDTYPVNRIHLHAVDLSDTVPQSTPSNFGIPTRLILEGSTREDFSDPRILLEFHTRSIFDIGPIITRRFPASSCRYIRLSAVEPYIYTSLTESGSRIGFAEVELFSEGRNVALGQPVGASFQLGNATRSFRTLTDGRNLYGDILPTRQWMNELARRHKLENERPLIIQELNRRYARQKTHLRIMSWLAVLLVAGIIIAVLVERMIHMHQLTRLKERFAADLHDELGANLHTIGLLSDMADEAREEPEDLTLFLQRIRSVTERTGSAVRHIINMQEAKGLFTGLENDMQRAATRILANLDHEISIEGQEYLAHIPPRKQNDLFLFYKECLVNAHKHANATHVYTRLIAKPPHVILSVEDNGRGITKPDGANIPSSLKRRAKLLGAQISVEHPAAGGSCITLNLHIRRFQLKKFRG
ncbi:Sensor histidine kinase LiaS [Pontiella desulfatans]|uniref:histidine kinase n=1 Tax=Pontiella desulfatans TaxID=2750659 RepID=A0A6C2UBZ3_PONDE|nr:histidine kinase [Pontiella desulfatans]VGO17692.1 Sensor histidine kinase LiaS [Pontiella desulfatans]